MIERKILWIGIVILAGLLLFAGVTTLNKQNEFNGVEISPAPAAPDFSSLTNQDGQRVYLKTYQDKVVLLFFGYTSCPDICPATMGRLKQVVADLGDKKDDVVVMMITTDPERDTQEQLENYLGNFDPDFLGVTGSISDLEETWKDYGVTVLDSGATHSTRVYVIDHSGNLRLTFPNEMSVGDMVSDLHVLIGER
jgi:protein SCO1/2